MKNCFLILGIMSLLTLPACAELTTSDTVNKDYLKNHGYSPALIQATQKSVAQINGEETTAQYEKEVYKNNVVKGIRRFFMYIDPSYDDQSFMNDHEIHTSPSYKDL